MTKQEIRSVYKAKRAAIDPRQKLKLDDLLLLQFQQLDYAGVETLLTYWPMAGQAEPNTHLFSGYLRHMLPDLQIAYPVSHQPTSTFTAVQIDESTVYQTNSWGITEPSAGIPLDPSAVDLVLVPLLAFDAEGYRVGYGKGFYDRFLANCREDVVTMGFSYFPPIARIADTGQFDVPLSYCITPDRIYEF